MKKLSVVMLGFCMSVGLQAAEKFTGTDLSGVYQCASNGKHEGDYTGKLKLTLDKENSYGTYAGYRMEADLPEHGKYYGSAAAYGDWIAIGFEHEDPESSDYGTAIGKVSNQNGKISFEKFTYESQYKGGNHGTGICVKQNS